jgi:hypothetical protein
VDIEQIKRHLESVGGSEKLMLLTPHYSEPPLLNSLNDPARAKVVWSNFITLAGAVEDILDDENEPPLEKEAFLLREFISMLEDGGLLSSGKDQVLVVAAKIAWPMYKLLSVYRCSVSKPMRALQDFDHLAFYADGAIQPLVPRIKSVVDRIDMLEQDQIEKLKGHQKELAEGLVNKIGRHKQDHEFRGQYKIMFLTGPDDSKTVKPAEAIINDKEGKNGNPVPFTYGARYVTLESLKSAGKTSELKSC